MGRLLAALPVQLEVPPAVVVIDPLVADSAVPDHRLVVPHAGHAGRGVAPARRGRAQRTPGGVRVGRDARTAHPADHVPHVRRDARGRHGLRSGQQRQSYFETLQVEADRLSHLVENVLQYSRLERGAGPKRRRSAWSWTRCWPASAPRLSDRAAQAGMTLETDADAADAGSRRDHRSGGRRADPDEPGGQRLQVRGRGDGSPDPSARVDRRAGAWPCGFRTTGPASPPRRPGGCSGRSRSPPSRPRTRRPASGWGWPSAAAWPSSWAAGWSWRTAPAAGATFVLTLPR